MMGFSAAQIHSAQLLQIVKNIAKADILTVCSLSVLVYDSLLTMEAEVRLIWRGKMGFGTLLYVMARYLTFVDVPLVLFCKYSQSSTSIVRLTWNQMILIVPCRHIIIRPVIHCILPTLVRKPWAGALDLLHFNPGTTAVGIAAAETILVLRTWALWGRNMRILNGLSALSLAILVPSIVFLIKFLNGIKCCYPIQSSRLLYVDYVLIGISETKPAVMLLTLWIGYTRYLGSTDNKLVYVLYRDGILYFVWLFLFSIGNVLVIILAPLELLDLLNTTQRVMHSLLATRIMLHVRALDGRLGKSDGFAFSSIKFHAFHGSSEESSDGTELSGGIEFERRGQGNSRDSDEGAPRASGST
ncbi:hypothetical protein C8J56DRAFT_883583 [Mycena floridula]|nr:hypothetical protein C8J56DRAFT_883583 [Mycena floridula]